MADEVAWRELHRSRFPELRYDCGNDADPGVIYSEDLRDWSDKQTTPDQYRMERYIDRFDLREKRILHIGIGNSGLAKRFGGRVAEIVGTTIDQPELSVAAGSGVKNYHAVMHNKFSGADAAEGRFDFILDNNPTSPCCCFRHLASLFEFYGRSLSPCGQVVTDRQGLEWLPDGSNPRWAFSFDDLAAVARTVGLDAYRATDTVFVLSRSPIPKPGTWPLIRHSMRRARAFPARVIRNGPQAANRLVRRAAKWLLLRTVPWALPRRYRSS